LQNTVQQNSPFVVMLQGAQLVALRQSVRHAQQSIGIGIGIDVSLL
jgi:peptide/nickel transport system substrate-binding protein